MFVRSFLGLKSEKSEKSRDRHSRHSPHRETPHHSTRHHHPRRRERSQRPGYASQRDFDDSDDYDRNDRRDPYPRDRQGHGKAKSQSRYEREADRERFSDENDRERYRRNAYREVEDERHRRGVDRGNDNDRDGRQSERRMEDGGYRSPSLSRALQIQAGETRQEMQDRVDGHSGRRPKHASEQEPRRSSSHEQREESPDRRSIPRRPGFTTTTSYQYPDKPMEDPAPGRLSKSATWPSKDPSHRPKPGGERSHLRHSDNQDSPDHRFHRKRDSEPARSPPLAQDDPTITPLHRGHTAFTTSDAYKSGLAGKPWSETERSLFSGSRMDRLPPPGPVRMLSQKDWESKSLDQDLAREIAFEDLGVTIEGEFPLVPVLTCGVIC
jgi:hypothetical protein